MAGAGAQSTTGFQETISQTAAPPQLLRTWPKVRVHAVVSCCPTFHRLDESCDRICQPETIGKLSITFMRKHTVRIGKRTSMLVVEHLELLGLFER